MKAFAFFFFSHFFKTCCARSNVTNGVVLVKIILAFTETSSTLNQILISISLHLPRTLSLSLSHFSFSMLIAYLLVLPKRHAHSLSPKNEKARKRYKS